MSDLFWLTDEQMERLRPFCPKSHGKPRVDDRRVLNGIIFVNRNGLRWRDAPPGQFGFLEGSYHAFFPTPRCASGSFGRGRAGHRLCQTVTNPAQVQSGSYAIEPGHTQVGFSLLHFGFTYVSEGIYETTAARPVLRAGGAGWYSELAETSMLDLRRPSSSDTALDEGADLPILPSTP